MTWTFFHHPRSSIAQALTPFFWPAIMLFNYNIMILNAFYSGISDSQAWMRGQWATLALGLGQMAPGTDPWTVLGAAASDAQSGVVDFLLWPVYTIGLIAWGLFAITFIALAEGYGGRVETGPSKRELEEQRHKKEQRIDPASESTDDWFTFLGQVVGWCVGASTGVLVMLSPLSPIFTVGWIVFSVAMVFIHGIQAEIVQRSDDEPKVAGEDEADPQDTAAMVENFRQTWLWTIRTDLSQLVDDPAANGWNRLRSRLEEVPPAVLERAITRLEDGEHRYAVLYSMIGTFELEPRSPRQPGWVNPLDELTHTTGQRPPPTHVYSFITRFRSAWSYWMQEFHPDHPANDVETKWLEMIQMLEQLQVDNPDYVIGLLRLFERESELSPRETRERVYEVLWEREPPRLSPRLTRSNSVASRGGAEALSPPTTPARRESDERLERDIAEAMNGPMPPEGGQGISGLTNGVAPPSSDEDDAEEQPAGPEETLPQVRPVAEETYEDVLGPAADSSSDSDNFTSFSTDWSAEDRSRSSLLRTAAHFNPWGTEGSQRSLSGARAAGAAETPLEQRTRAAIGEAMLDYGSWTASADQPADRPESQSASQDEHQPQYEHQNQSANQSANQQSRPAASGGTPGDTSSPGAMTTVPYDSTTAGPLPSSDPVARSADNNEHHDSIWDCFKSMLSGLWTALGFIFCFVCAGLSRLDSKPQPGISAETLNAPLQSLRQMEEMQPLVSNEARPRRAKPGPPGTGIATIPEVDEEAEDGTSADQNMSGGLPRPSGESEERASAAAPPSPPPVDGYFGMARSGSYPGDPGTNVPNPRRSGLPSGSSASNASPPVPHTQDGRAFSPVRVVSETRMRKGKKQASRRGRGATNPLESTAAATNDAGDRSASSGSNYSREPEQDEQMSRAASRTAKEYLAEYSALVAEDSSQQPDAKLEPSQADALSVAGWSSRTNSIQPESDSTVAEVWKDRAALRASAPDVTFTRPSTESREIDEAETSDQHLHPGPFLPQTGTSGGWRDVGK